MRGASFVGLLTVFLVSLVTALEPEHSVDIFAWPLSAPKAQTLAKVAYNSTHASVKSYSKPTFSDQNDVVRVGYYHPSGEWSGVATSASNFGEGKTKKLLLHVTSAGDLYHVGFKASEYGTSGTTSSSQQGDLTVEVLKVKPGPTPHLNKPVVMNPDGTVGEKEPEKTFLQKYWWAIAGFLVLQLVLNGSKE